MLLEFFILNLILEKIKEIMKKNVYNDNKYYINKYYNILNTFFLLVSKLL